MCVVNFEEVKNIKPMESNQWKLRSMNTTAKLCSQCGIRKEQEGNCLVCDSAPSAVQNIRSRAYITYANYLRYTLAITEAPDYAVAA